jgi:hypothetical protein
MHFSSVSSPWLVNSTSNVFFSGQPFTVTQTSGGFLGLLPILHSTCHPCGSTVLGVVNASLSLFLSHEHHENRDHSSLAAVPHARSLL